MITKVFIDANFTSGRQIIGRAVLSYAIQEVAVQGPDVESVTLVMKLDRPTGVDFPSMQTSDIVRLGYVGSLELSRDEEVSN